MIRENFKKVGIFNLALILFVMIYDSIRLATGHSLMPKIVILVHFVAYFAGMTYAFNGYKKDSAIYHKAFMLCLSLSEILSLVDKINRPESSTFSVILSGICVAISFVLLFGKDLGSKFSISICSLSLAIHIYNFFHVLINSTSKFQAVTGPISDSIMLIIALVFIVAKYEDKKMRGSN